MIHSALGSRYAIGGALGRGVKREAAGGWWLTGGIPAANCIGAYQATGAESYELSKVNLANPGTYDLVETTVGLNMTWNGYDGWKSPGIALNPGITPEADQTWSMIVRFTNAVTDGRTIAGSENTSAAARFYLWARRGSADDRLYGNGGFAGVGARVANGVMAISGANCFYNKSSDGAVSGGWAASARSILINGINSAAGTSGVTVTNSFDGYIQAIAIYDIPIDSYMDALTDAMNAIAGASPAYVPGLWSWFTKPLTVYYNDNVYFSAIDTQTQDLNIYKYDISATKLTSLVMDYVSGEDDHNNGSILIRDSDKKLLYFRCLHNDSTINLSISTNAEDISAWGTAVSLDAQLGGSVYNYPIPIQLTGEASDPIYLFYKEMGVGLRSEYYSVSTDGGANWSAGTLFFTNGAERPYFQIARNGTDRIDFTCTQGHPNEVAGCSIYHFYYTGAKWYKSDGTEITGALPLEPADVTTVYDGSTVEGWVWDIAIDGSGNPIIVFATFPTPASDHRYNYARWTGSAWDVHEICTAGGPLYAGEPYYSGGISIDKGDTNTIYCSRVYGGQWEIFKYVTADGGANWTATQITTGSSSMNARPMCPDGVTGLAPLYWYGTYTAYDNADCRVKYK